MASILLPYPLSLHSTDLEEMGRNKQPAGPTKMVDWKGKSTLLLRPNENNLTQGSAQGQHGEDGTEN